MSEWKDISTAPKDGTWVLISGGSIWYGWSGDTIPTCVVGQFLPTSNSWQFAWYDGGFYGEYETPTHWMPLPPPPKGGE
jgi:hypothetical protein